MIQKSEHPLRLSNISRMDVFLFQVLTFVKDKTLFSFFRCRVTGQERRKKLKQIADNKQAPGETPGAFAYEVKSGDLRSITAGHHCSELPSQQHR